MAIKKNRMETDRKNWSKCWSKPSARWPVCLWVCCLHCCCRTVGHFAGADCPSWTGTSKRSRWLGRWWMDEMLRWMWL